MISYGVRNATIDADGPDARTFASRTTVYIAVSGKDNYLGNSTTRPVVSIVHAEQILQTITFAGGTGTIIGVNETVMPLLSAFEFIPADATFNTWYYGRKYGTTF